MSPARRRLCSAAERAWRRRTPAADLVAVHVVYRFDTGGLENGVVNLINHMPAGAYRHAVLALTEVTDFAAPHRARRRCRVRRAAQAAGPRLLAVPDAVPPVPRAAPGHRAHPQPGRARSGGAGVGCARSGPHPRRAWPRRRRPATAQSQVPAGAPAVPPFVAPLRRAVARPARLPDWPSVRRAADAHHADLQRRRYRALPSAAGARRSAIAGCPFDPARHWLVGTVGRMQAVKDQLDAGARLRARARAGAATARARCAW